jgi:hypothetical protein
MSYEIRELKLGGILDQGSKVLKDNFGLLFGILACAWIPYQLIAGFVQLAMMREVSPESPLDALAAASEILPVTIGFALVGTIIILPLTNAAVIYAVAQRYLGNDVTVLESIQKGFSKILPLIWTSILMGLAIMGGLILLIIPGILFALWFGLAQHVVVLEDESGTAALGRSKTLVRPYLGTFLMLGILIFVIAASLGFGAGFVQQPHLQTLAQVLINAVVTLLSTAVFVVFYFSCRSGVENFDLEHLAASVGQSASSRISSPTFEETP